MSHLGLCTIYWEIFMFLKFFKIGNFNYFSLNNFANDPSGQHIRCGMATFFSEFIFVNEQNS